MNRMALDKDEVWPVFHLQNPLSTSLHFTNAAFEEDPAVMSLGFGSKQNSTGDRSKRESYQGEYFTPGGIDLTDCFNAEPSPYQLNTGSDYQNVMKELECNFPDLGNLWGTEVQLYDPNLAGTTGSGSVAAFRGSDHASSISVVPKCPSGIRHKDRCAW